VEDVRGVQGKEGGREGRREGGKQEKQPSEYGFSVYGAEDDQKWKMCAASKVRKEGGREGGREGE
jgi:hypothetical protein